MPRSRGNITIYGLIAVLAILSIVILFRLRQQFESNLQGRVADLQRVFSNRTLLKLPSEYKVNFADIEAEVAKYENRGDFGAIRIAKQFGVNLHTVYPFYYPALQRVNPGLVDQMVAPADHGLWDQFLASRRITELPLVSEGELLGTITVGVNYSALRTVSLVIWALAGMLAVTLAFLATQFRRQEKVISATTVELEEKRRELVRLERLALAGQLSANILHDLKKPVLNIRNEADEALHPHGNTPSENPETVFKRMREQADFFLTVLREGGFDRFVRAQEEREYVDINELMDRSLALVRYEQGSVEINRKYTVALPAVLAEPVRLIQVFSNLILNACQAMEGHGELVIKTTYHAGQYILVEVNDNGPGIPEGQQAHIFEPFFTTKPSGQGTGLGLYIVNDIIRDLGGHIKVSSQPGMTVFSINIPVSV